MNTTDAKLVLDVLQQTPRALESEKLSHTKPRTICTKNVTNHPSHNANINVDFEDIVPSEDPQPIFLAVLLKPTIPNPPDAAVVNRRHI